MDAVLAEMPRLQAAIPPTIKIDVAVDRTTTIRASVHDVEISLIISVLLVVLVVFLFLREVWATIIPSVAVPLSLVGTFGVMYLLGYTIDNLSLMALTISTGFVVDDAIVVIENITRYLEMGMKPFDAAMKGSKEIGFTVLSMSTSLIAVFIPILLMGGIVGKLFREFAVTLSVAIAVSLLVSLTTTPMLCAQFLKSRDESRHGRIYRCQRERSSSGFTTNTTRACAGCCATRCSCSAWLSARVVLNVYLFIIVPKGFFPQQDTGRLGGSNHGRAGHQLSRHARQAARTGADGARRSRHSIGDRLCRRQRSRRRQQQHRLHVHRSQAAQPAPRPRHPPTRSFNRLRRKLTSVPGATLFLQVQQDIQIGGRGCATRNTSTRSPTKT